MIDREKVIEALQHCKDNQYVFDCHECDYGGKTGTFCIRMIDDTLALLKEQEAKQVINIDDSFEGMEVGNCPSCNRAIVNIKIGETKFCKFCGQAVKWE